MEDSLLTFVPAPWRDRQGDSWKMMDCDTEAVYLTALEVNVGGGGVYEELTNCIATEFYKSSGTTGVI